MANSSIQNEELYEDLRERGDSQEKAARTSNAVASRGARSVARRGGRFGAYEGWTVVNLRKRAKELGLKGYSTLSKDKLVDELRSH